MDRKDFIKTSSIAAIGLATMPNIACSSEAQLNLSLPSLNFSFDALEPHIDALTMEIHHGKHHAGYVRKANAALKGTSVKGKTVEIKLSNITDSEELLALRNNLGGHYNHTLFWNCLSPKKTKMNDKLNTAITSSFGSVENFKNTFATQAKSRFGSGWAWLIVDEKGELKVTSTANQDNPLMKNLVETPGNPILGIDVWEHAYYLNYQNKRGDYINNFWNIVNWDFVSSKYESLI